MNALQKLIYLEQDARKFGFDWPDHFMILDQIIDECREVREEIDQGSNKEKLEEEIGDLLHSVISICVFSRFDIEETISKTNAKFSKRMQLLKKLTKQKGLENLQGQSIDFMLNIWREVKKIEHLSDIPQDCIIVSLAADHIQLLSGAFNQIGWHKPSSLFEEYLKEQEAGERLVWVAKVQDEFAGYVTLKWQSHYPSFQAQNIPEIKDLNVLPAYRKIGVGSLLLDTAEKEAATKGAAVGIGVGLYAGEDGGYGPAQRLYIKRGYIPDGKGVTYHYQPTMPGNSYPLDDGLVLWFTRKLRGDL
jgi:GNAT superfamily N-acetyltransferase/NTP pyrophosphatase (non-canonical NTP hydrolase)